MREIIKMKYRTSRIKHRPIYSTNDLDDFQEKTHIPRKYFFRNVYLIHEDIPQLGITSKYLELRTLRKIYRYYIF